MINQEELIWKNKKKQKNIFICIESPVFCKSIKWNWEEGEKKGQKSLKNQSLIRLMLLFHLGLQQRKKLTPHADKLVSAAWKYPETHICTVHLCVKNK